MLRPILSKPSTIIVASYNRPRQLRECLTSLCRLDHPDFRIIVVDDGSDTPLNTVVSDFGDRVTVMRQQNKGPAAARNLGVEAATGDFVAFTDDDCRPDVHWLSRLEAAHRRCPEALVGGGVVNGYPRNKFSGASQRVMDFLYRWYDETDQRMRFFTTNNIGFSRRVFLNMGKLDPFFRFASEDRDLGLRWQASGLPLVYCPEARVRHFHHLSLASFFAQHASYGRGARRLHLKLGDDPRLNLEPFWFYTGLLLEPFRSEHDAPILSRAAQSALIALSQVAMTCGYTAERLRGGGHPPEFSDRVTREKAQ